jgi:hypothetical protein
LIFEIIILLQLSIRVNIHDWVAYKVCSLDIPNNIVEFVLFNLREIETF